MTVNKISIKNCIHFYDHVEYIKFPCLVQKEKLEDLQRLFDRLGHYAVEAFHYLALFIIGCMIAWSMPCTR